MGVQLHLVWHGHERGRQWRRPEWRARIPAVVHVDDTARPQIIRDADNPLFAGILRRFRDRTGIPVLINTSFNVHEEPIVNRPEECRRALIDGRVDFVVTRQAVYIAERSAATKPAAAGAQNRQVLTAADSMR